MSKLVGVPFSNGMLISGEDTNVMRPSFQSYPGKISNHFYPGMGTVPITQQAYSHCSFVINNIADGEREYTETRTRRNDVNIEYQRPDRQNITNIVGGESRESRRRSHGYSNTDRESRYPDRNNYRYPVQTDRFSDRFSTNQVYYPERNDSEIYNSGRERAGVSLDPNDQHDNRDSLYPSSRYLSRNRYPVQTDRFSDQYRSTSYHQPEVYHHEDNSGRERDGVTRIYHNYHDNRIIYNYGYNPIEYQNSNSQQSHQNQYAETYQSGYHRNIYSVHRPDNRYHQPAGGNGRDNGYDYGNSVFYSGYGNMRNDERNQNQNREFHHDGYHPDRNQIPHHPSQNHAIGPQSAVSWFIPVGASASPDGQIHPDVPNVDSNNPAKVIELEPEYVPPGYDNPGTGLDNDQIDATEPERADPAEKVSRDVEPEVLEDVNTGNQNFSSEADPDDVSKQQLEADPTEEVSAEPQVVDPEPDDDPAVSQPQLQEGDPEQNYVEYDGVVDDQKEPEPEEPEETHMQSEQQEEPDQQEYVSLPEDVEATPPIQNEKKSRKGFWEFFTGCFKSKTQERVDKKKQKSRKTTDQTVEEISQNEEYQQTKEQATEAETTKRKRQEPVEKKTRDEVKKTTDQAQTQQEKPKEEGKKPPEKKQNALKKKIDDAKEKAKKITSMTQGKVKAGFEKIKKAVKAPVKKIAKMSKKK
jgi:hypothetical protein